MAQEIERLGLSRGQSSITSGYSQTQTQTHVNVAMTGGSGSNSNNGSEIRQKYDILENIHVKLKREHDCLREKLA